MVNRILPFIKKIIAVAALIFIGLDLVRDFRENDPIHYFIRQPGQFLWVAVISIGGGLATLVFTRSSPRWQRYLKLFAFGAAATFLTASTVSAIRLFVQLSRFAGISKFSAVDYIVPASLVVATSVLWFLFFRAATKPIA
jgi:hypothetical protein